MTVSTKEQMQCLITEYVQTLRKEERPGVRKLLQDDMLEKWYEDCDYEEILRRSVSALNNGKLTALQRYRLFIKWLSVKTNTEIKINWPTADISNRFERLIAIVRLLQNMPPKSENEAVLFLSEKLWVTDRTIREDIKNLREGNDLYQYSALNQAFGIEGMSASAQPIRFLSSVHPMLLLENMTGVILLIESLLEKAQHSIYHDSCMVTALHVWSQLTEYAKTKVGERIQADYVNKIELLALFAELNQIIPSTSFRSEQALLSSIPNIWMHYMKMTQFCQVEYKDKNGNRQVINGFPEGQEGKEYILRDVNQSTTRIQEEDIISIVKAR